MADSRFFVKETRFDLVAALVDYPPPPSLSKIDDVAALESATSGTISFFENKARYADALASCQASVILIRKAYAELLPPHSTPWISQAPYADFCRIVDAFYPPAAQRAKQRLQNDETIHKSAKIGEATQCGIGAVIGADVQIGANCIIEPNAIIGNGVTIGNDCHIGAGSQISHALIGDNVILQGGCYIGHAGFGFNQATPPVRIPHIGRVIIQSGVELGTLVSVSRGTFGDTVIGEHSKIDAQVRLGHNVQIGRQNIVVSGAVIGGGACLGDNVQIGGGTAIRDGITIGNNAILGGGAVALKNIPEGAVWQGNPAQAARDWRRELIALKKLRKQQ